MQADSLASAAGDISNMAPIKGEPTAADRRQVKAEDVA